MRERAISESGASLPQADCASHAVVCLHGLGRVPSDWEGVRDGLGRYGTVRTPTLSRRPADALNRADRAVGADDVVIGHSMGGVLALRLAERRHRPLRAVVLTGCFFRPARNSRSLRKAVGDYAAHRRAFVSSLDRHSHTGGSRGSARALSLLIRLAVQPAQHDAAMLGLACPVLVVHARDDHHVPIDFAVAAATRYAWDLQILDHGGHNAHRDAPQPWLEAVTPWLDTVVAAD